MKAVIMLTMMLAVTMVQVVPNQATRRDEDVKKTKSLRKDVEELTKVVTSLKTKLTTVESIFQAIQIQQADSITSLGSRVTSVETKAKNQGSSFVRWGWTTCPNGSTTVYSGLVGAKHYNSKGHGTNILCMSKSPRFDNMSPTNGNAHVWGAEYNGIPHHYNHDAPCSVCQASQSTTIMVPGTNMCPTGWTRQYYGNLVASNHDHYATEYICLDAYPQDDRGGELNNKGWTIFYVTAACGSLSCPPYVNNKVLTCVVCSK
ncbi:short-chain collagen C4-like [Littorina saxatilis]|uniref:short-chain collagen C4-like n=1 Tax=Littorina saxatilis TaxID=31220 RepID=UPI0038B5696B